MREPERPFPIRWTPEAQQHVHRLQWKPPRKPRQKKPQEEREGGTSAAIWILAATWPVWILPAYLAFYASFAVYQACVMVVAAVRFICDLGEPS